MGVSRNVVLGKEGRNVRVKRLATGRCKREMEIVGEWSGWQGRLEKGKSGAGRDASVFLR